MPPRARLQPWHVSERNGLVLIWHHGAGLDPQWEIPDLPEFGDDAWTPYEKRRWRVRTHNQEMAENAVDRAHFRYVHGTLTVPETKATMEGPALRVCSKMKLGTPAGEVEGAIASDSWGFGYGIVRFSGIVDTLTVTSVTPIDGTFVDVRFAFNVKKIGSASTTRGVGAALIADIEKQMSEDIPIWETKRYLARPVLCDGDGPIGLFRRWAGQFYSVAAG